MSLPPVLASAREAAASLASAPAPPWLASLRRDALAVLLERGLPGPGEEAWRGFDLAALASIPFRPAPAEAASRVPRALLEQHFLFEPSVTRLVFVNGRFQPGLSAQPGLPRGVRILPLARAVRAVPEVLRRYLGLRSGLKEHPFLALNGALLEDLALIHLEDGATLARPVHFLFVTTNGADPVLSQARVLVVAGRRSRVGLVETHLGPQGGRYLANAVCQIHAAEGAAVEHAVALEDSREAIHLGRIEIRLEAGAAYRGDLLSFGGHRARTELDLTFQGPGAHCELAGLLLADGERQAEVRTLVDHAVPDCSSSQEFRTVAAERARGAYAGRVLVRPGARGSAAEQSCRGLLLARGARADALPQLEIHTDEVTASHGVAIGELDGEALFYLRSRGLGLEQARSILTLAFAGAITQRIQVPALRCRVDRMLAERLGSVVSADAEAPGAPILETV